MARGAGRCSAALPERPPRRSCRPLHPVRGGIPPMEQLLIKMARQLDALDEASLLALWDRATPSSFPISNPRSVGRKRRWFFRSFRPSGGKTSCSITAGRRRYIPARRRSPSRSRTFFWTRQRAGLLLRSPSAKPRLSSSARTAVQRRMPPKSPAEKAEAAGKPFFPPDSR